MLCWLHWTHKLVQVQFVSSVDFCVSLHEWSDIWHMWHGYVYIINLHPRLSNCVCSLHHNLSNCGIIKFLTGDVGHFSSNNTICHIRFATWIITQSHGRWQWQVSSSDTKYPTKNTRPTFHVLQRTTAKFGMHAANMIFNIQNEEWAVTRLILPVYFSTEHVW